MYDFDLYTKDFGQTSGIINGVAWTIVATILSIIGGILLYVLFVNKKDKVENKYLAWIKEFLSFKKMLIEVILKVSYIIVTIFITLTSFNIISTSFLGFLLYLIIGNIIARLIYEGSLILLMIWKNTSEINKKIK